MVLKHLNRGDPSFKLRLWNWLLTCRQQMDLFTFPAPVAGLLFGFLRRKPALKTISLTPVNHKFSQHWRGMSKGVTSLPVDTSAVDADPAMPPLVKQSKVLTTIYNHRLPKDRPQRFLTPYLIFCQDVLADIRRTQPEMPTADRFAFAGRKWKTLDKAEQLRYGSENNKRRTLLDKAARTGRPTTSFHLFMAHALNELHAQKTSLPKSPRANFTEAIVRWKNVTPEERKRFADDAEQLNEARRTLRAEGRISIKHPPPPVAMFIRAHRGEKPAGVSQPKFIADLSKRWTVLPDAEKNAYRERHKLAYDEYLAQTGKPHRDYRRRPVNKWSLFVTKQMIGRPGDVSVTQYIKTIGEQWKVLSDDEKKCYVDEAAELLKQYRAWQHEEKNLRRLADSIGSSGKTDRALRKADVSARHQMPVFSLFVQEQMIDRPAEISAKAYLKDLGKKWRTLGDDDKQKYKQMAIAYKKGQEVTQNDQSSRNL